MPVECTNSNLKSAQMAQLRQPAKNWYPMVDLQGDPYSIGEF